MSTPDSEKQAPPTKTDDDVDAVEDLETSEHDDVKGGKKGEPQGKRPRAY